MKLSVTAGGFALYKESDIIGQCSVTPAPKGADIASLSILPQWRRKGYGSYLLKEILRRFGGYDREAATVFTAPLPADEGEGLFWKKFGFVPEGGRLCRRRTPDLTAVRLVQDYLAAHLHHVRPGTADIVMFNFGWLPGADHRVFSTADSSIPALEAALTALRPGGVLSAILYSGRVIGTGEKQSILGWLRALPLEKYTVLVCDFANWADTAPLPCLVLKK